MNRRERRIVVGTEIIFVTVMLEPEFHHSIVKEFEGRVNLQVPRYDARSTLFQSKLRRADDIRPYHRNDGGVGREDL